MQDNEILEFTNRLGLKFNNVEVIRSALTSKAYSLQFCQGDETGRRLAYTGDSLLQWFVARHFLKYATDDVTLNAMHQTSCMVVSKTVLGRIAEQLRINAVIRVTYAESVALEQHRKRSILCEAFEALLGAVIVEQGVSAAECLLERFLPRICDAVIEQEAFYHPKHLLNPLVKRQFHVLPTYRTRKIKGNSRDIEHGVTWATKCFAKKRLLAEAEGHGKDHAESAAAIIALSLLFDKKLTNIYDIVDAATADL